MPWIKASVFDPVAQDYNLAWYNQETGESKPANRDEYGNWGPAPQDVAQAPTPAPEQSLADRMAAFTPSQWASERGLGDMERLINFKQALPPEFMQQLLQGSSAPSGDPQDMWNDYVRRAQYNPSPTLAETLTQPQNLFFAGTTGLGGMTLANAATGGDVGAGVQQDALTLASTAAGQYLAGQGAFAPEVANSGMDFGGQGVGWSPDTITGATEALSPVAQSAPVSQPTTLQELLQSSEPFTGGGLKVSSELPTGGLENVIAGSNMAGGATGITPGVTASGLGMEGAGAGLTVPGVTGMGTTGVIGTAGLGLGAGALAADAVGGSAPAALGGTGAATVAGPAAAAATAAGAGVGATKLGDILSGDVGVGDLASKLTLSDLGNVAGTGIATVGSVLAQQDIAARNEALAREYMGYGAPSRTRYEASFAPGFDITQDPALKSALDASNESMLRKASINGNPAGNPGVLAEILKYATSNVALPYLQNYRNQNASTGGFGAFSTAAPGAANNAINATGSMYGDIAGGLADILNPRRQQKQVNLNVLGLT